MNNPSTFDEVRRQYNIYKQQYDSLWEHFGNNDNPISEEESHFISNMYHCRGFQLEHHIILTSEQNEACIKWFDEDNDFELWFAGSGVEIDHEPTYIDYLITDSLELKILRWKRKRTALSGLIAIMTFGLTLCILHMATDSK